jgi:hypothetical protein
VSVPNEIRSILLHLDAARAARRASPSRTRSPIATAPS